MSEDAHEVVWPWKNHINQFYLDEIRRQNNYSANTFRKEYCGEWLSNDAGPIKRSDIIIDKSLPKGRILIDKVSFDVDKFLRERGPFEPTLQDFLRFRIENETLVMSDEIRNALKALKKYS